MKTTFVPVFLIIVPIAISFGMSLGRLLLGIHESDIFVIGGCLLGAIFWSIKYNNEHSNQ